MAWKVRVWVDVPGARGTVGMRGRESTPTVGDSGEKRDVMGWALDPSAAPHGGWACEHSMLGGASGAQARPRAVARPRCVQSACRAGLQLISASPRATSNAWVRATVALELSYVNSSLQLLKEELEELNGSSVEADRPEGCVCAWDRGSRVRG